MASLLGRATLVAAFLSFIAGSSARGQEQCNATDRLGALHIGCSPDARASVTPIPSILSQPTEGADSGTIINDTTGSQMHLSRPISSDESAYPTANPLVESGVANISEPEELPDDGPPNIFFRPRIELSETDWAQGNEMQETPSRRPTPTKPPTVTNPATVTIGDNVLTPVPVPAIVIGDKTLTPGGRTVTIGDKPSRTVIHLDPSGRPVVVIGGSTSTHQGIISGGDSPATRVIPPLTVGDVTATIITDYQYVVGGSTLTVGQSITVGNQILSLSKDPAGGIIFVESGATTALTHGGLLDGLPIFTTVVSGTVLYVVGSQTLGPGSPITLNGTPVSLTSSSGSTFGLVGGTTTPIRGPTITPPVMPAGDLQVVSSPTSAKSGATFGGRSPLLSVRGIVAFVVMIGMG
ncbi:uncharacterized protein EI97DRAFT_123783 [Westerdykella ornata]|uniref:Uncharacterized protein n=1 Tax=Westerdykella ornata TaxID=318751 RepID=A0A6A6JV12_WESOR|nr:uncharacterized protein EI97DRAFT_123783 [Westerdykella ornata]KAF2280460.1 hypothetical protein EI97DRAFT_123783 [Westerdykella ornata]